jgi:putative hydrolase of the HAD superfamily
VLYVFDAYGTLVELDDFQGRLHRALEARGCRVAAEAVSRAARREMSFYMAHAVRARCEASYLALRAECAGVLRNALAEIADCKPDVKDVESALAEAIRFRPFAEVRSVREQLQARGAALAVASNWDYALPQHLESLGLAHYFRFILTSASVGIAKPAPAFFKAVRDKVRDKVQSFSDLLYVGDHFENDVLAARAAGFQARWLVRDKRDVASGETPEHTKERPISSLTELL